MDEPFTTFDTLSVDAYEPLAVPGASNPLPVLARLPQLAEPTAPSIQRYDSPVDHLSGRHQGEGEPISTVGTATTRTASFVGDPTSTIRIDTFAPGSLDSTAPAPSLRSPSPEPSCEAPADELSSWLLQAEAVVLPYSRWIVLAAVVAALGLTLVLLRGAGSTVLLDAPAPQPRVGLGVLNDGFAANGSPETPAIETLADRPVRSNESAPPNDYLRPIDSAATPPIAQLSAAGPASAPVGQALPRAELSGGVLAPETARIDVANRPGVSPYPQTTTNGPGGFPGSLTR